MSIFVVGFWQISYGEDYSGTQISIPQKYTRLFYYRNGKDALASLSKNYDSIDVLAPQSYSVGADGVLSGKVDPFVLSLAEIHAIKVMPLVTNKAFNKDHAHNFLDNSVLQDRAISDMVSEAKKFGYSGWQIDFEQIDVSYRDKFSDFIKKFSSQMRLNNLVASVAVIAQVSENPFDYSKSLWQKLIGVYDYRSLASSADFISIMSYDDPTSKGPVAGYVWMEKVLNHALSLVPAEKISLGVPLYYWLWNDTKGKLVEIGGYQGILGAFKKHYLVTHWSKTENAPYLTWRSYYNNYILWYENAMSIEKKLELVTKNKLHGFSAWALGLEVPTVHNKFQKLN